MPKIAIILFSLIVVMTGVGFYLYRVSPASLPQQLTKPSPSSTEIPSTKISIQSPMQEAVINDLAKRLMVDSKTISVIKMEAAGWSDGSLGCPVSGRAYTQATTSGYEIILQSFGKNHIYHAVNSNNFVYCNPEEAYKCTEDSQCGVNICDCKAMFNPYISPQKKACTLLCQGTPKCVNNKCQLVN